MPIGNAYRDPVAAKLRVDELIRQAVNISWRLHGKKALHEVTDRVLIGPPALVDNAVGAVRKDIEKALIRAVDDLKSHIDSLEHLPPPM